MPKKILHFIHYHNFFTIAVIFVSIWVSTALAVDQNLQQSLIAKNQVARSVDNTYIVNTDFGVYDVGLKIISVTEDADRYYVEYSYNTAEVVDYVWKPIAKYGSMKISKLELGGRDLGLYVANQLGQVADQQLSYLKDVQKEEEKIGITQKIVATEYTGLVGQFLNTDEEIFDGYVPVKPPVEVTSDVPVGDNNTVIGTALGVTLGTPSTPLTREEMQVIIQNTVRELLLGGNQSATTTTIVTPPADIVIPPVTPPVDTATTTPPVDVPITPPADIPPTDTATTTPPVDVPITPPADIPPTDTATTTP